MPLTLSIPLEPEREPSVRIAPLENENMVKYYQFHIDKPKGIDAHLYYNHEENRYIIAKGSIIKAIDGEIRPNLLRMRQEVISNSDMSEQKGDYYKLKADIELLKSSRSDSASFWKDREVFDLPSTLSLSGHPSQIEQMMFLFL